jgi:hypothetical protein
MVLEENVGIIKDAIVSITRSFLGGFMFFAFNHTKRTNGNEKIAPKLSAFIKRSPDDGDDDRGGPPPPPIKSS